jgi:hypothetical protein
MTDEDFDHSIGMYQAAATSACALTAGSLYDST